MGLSDIGRCSWNYDNINNSGSYILLNLEAICVIKRVVSSLA